MKMNEASQLLVLVGVVRDVQGAKRHITADEAADRGNVQIREDHVNWECQESDLGQERREEAWQE
jgi:hypothetical protein